ncbi:MAG: hypothetical protein Q4G47_08010 [Lachnospiraceae bacterium]|nr:hypothetical protein [Lachnospiraceae bacterium]
MMLIMHTLFTLEDQYTIHAELIDGEPVLRFGTDIKKRSHLWDLFYSWAAEASRLQNGEITEEEYNNGVITIRDSTREICGRKCRPS